MEKNRSDYSITLSRKEDGTVGIYINYQGEPLTTIGPEDSSIVYGIIHEGFRRFELAWEETVKAMFDL